MDLTTQCPQCGTEFEVSLQQLQLRKGYIRCVNCAHIFDGYEAVVPEKGSEHRVSTHTSENDINEPQFSAPAPRARTSSSEPQFIVSPREPDASVPIRTRHAAETAAFTVRDVDELAQGRRHTVGPTDAEPSSHGTEERSGLYIEPRGAAYVPSEYDDDEPRSGLGAGGVLLSLLIVLGLAAALLQGAYIYRVQIASEVPALRPALERYCEALECTVDYPRRLSQIAIMDSSLQEVRDDADADNLNERDTRMMLDVVLRNNFEKPQQWPSMSLELVDFSGVVAVRRALAPADYLPELSLQRPFPAKSELRVSVPILVDDMRINGYQLDTFFP